MLTHENQSASQQLQASLQPHGRPERATINIIIIYTSTWSCKLKRIIYSAHYSIIDTRVTRTIQVLKERYRAPVSVVTPGFDPVTGSFKFKYMEGRWKILAIPVDKLRAANCGNYGTVYIVNDGGYEGGEGACASATLQHEDDEQLPVYALEEPQPPPAYVEEDVAS